LALQGLPLAEPGLQPGEAAASSPPD